ncbi:MAG: type II secretion system protein [Candidatus Zixiibacteriota bacterium]
MYRRDNQQGYSLVELLVVIIIIGVIASVAMRSMNTTHEASRTEQTKAELDQLAFAIAGDPALLSNGLRIDFGYVGDVGALPANLDALVTNPGGYATWKGPYLHDDFYASAAATETEFKVDGWGTLYTYAGVTITSNGSGSPITRQIANSSADLLYNRIQAVILDFDRTPPGSVYKDSVKLVVTYPNGSGSTTTKESFPSADGSVQFDSIPIGPHQLSLVYLPNIDTVVRTAVVNTGQTHYLEMQYYADVWGDTATGGGGSALQLVSGTQKVKGGNCDKIEFNIINTSTSDIVLSSITATWSTPAAWYEKVKLNGTVYDSNNPRMGSTELTTFSSNKTVVAGQTYQVKLEKFRDSQTGGANKVDMSNSSLTVTFSDGSSMTVPLGACQ